MFPKKHLIRSSVLFFSPVNGIVKALFFNTKVFGNKLDNILCRPALQIARTANRRYFNRIQIPTVVIVVSGVSTIHADARTCWRNELLGNGLLNNLGSFAPNRCNKVCADYRAVARLRTPAFAQNGRSAN